MKLPELRLFKNKFISLVITPNQLKAVKVNVKRNSVIKFAQVSIPPGIIVNYHVKDKEALVKLIGELWQKNRISDKYVGIVVPEFSTYTKSLELPNLSDIEIREALELRIQEHLPVPVEDVIFDWKIIRRDKEKVEVLTVAILKEVLFSYVDAVAAAGLSPLVVETPSLSIQRIIDTDDKGKLIIYVSTSDATLVITSKNEIIASSVVTTGNLNNIVSTARQMLAHYSDVAIEKVLISGVGLTQDLVQFLNYNLGRTVQFADIKLNGLAPAQAQDYLVGISLQRKDAAPPESEFTVNLLPPEWAEYYKKQSLGIREWTLTLIASVIVWVTFLSVLMVFMFLNIQAQSLKSSNSDELADELNKAVSEVKAVNAVSEEVIAFNEKLVYPQEVLNLLASTNPDGVNINSYRVNFETGEVVLDCFAASVDNLLEFKNVLDSKKEDLAILDFPTSSLFQESDISFEVVLSYKKLVQTRKAPAKLAPSI